MWTPDISSPFGRSALTVFALAVVALACGGPESTSPPELGSEFAYVTNEDSHDLSIIATATNEVVATIPVGTRPRGVRVSRTGRTVYVALSGSPKCPPSMPDEECARQVVDKTKDGIAVIGPAGAFAQKPTVLTPL